MNLKEKKEEKEVFGIIPKPAPKLPARVNILLAIALILVLLAVGSFFFLQMQIEALQDKKATLDQEITQVENETQIVLAEELFEASKKISDFSRFTKEHKTASALFDFLREVCHPAVQLSEAKLDMGKYELQLKGETENFKFIGEQLLALKQHPQVTSIKTPTISFGKEGKASFSVTLTLVESLFTQ